jgi:hypothetical protein
LAVSLPAFIPTAGRTTGKGSHCSSSQKAGRRQKFPAVC